MSILTLEPIVRADDLFDRLDNEGNQQSDKTFQVERITGLGRLLEGFDRALKVPFDYRGLNAVYEDMQHLTPVASAEDIEKFSKLLKPFQTLENFDFLAGLYLSSLINNSVDSDFRISLSSEEKRIRSLGYLNKKNIIVNGNIYGIGSLISGNIEVTGDCEEIKNIYGGNILVRGNCDYPGQCMTGGFVEVLGDASCVGSSSSRGKIIIHGNVLHYVGDNSSGEIHIGGHSHKVGFGSNGGKIFLHGSYDEIDNLGCKAKVYGKVKGKWRRLK